MRRALSFTGTFGAVAFAVIACGSAGPLDDTAPGPGRAPDASADAPAFAEAAAPIVDAGEEAGPLACAGCVIGTCGQQIVSCLGSAQCLGILECATTTCLGAAGPSRDGGKATNGGGGLDASCLLGCLSKNPAGALSVLGIFQCVSSTCGSDCGTVLGGLGGLGGLSGGLGGLGGSGGGKKAPIDQSQLGPIDRDAFREIFSSYPELVSR